MAKMNKIMPPRNTTIRGQDHLLAYITPEEAQMLMDNGGAGKAGPMGIPAFYSDDDDMFASEAMESFESNYGGGGSDDDSPEPVRQGQITGGETLYTSGSPTLSVGTASQALGNVGGDRTVGGLTRAQYNDMPFYMRELLDTKSPLFTGAYNYEFGPKNRVTGFYGPSLAGKMPGVGGLLSNLYEKFLGPPMTESDLAMRSVYTGFGAGNQLDGGRGGYEEVKPVNPETGQCDEGYMFDEDMQACRLDTGYQASAPAAGGGVMAQPGDAYARMGLLDVAPTGLPQFQQQYGAGFGTPSQFADANLAFRQRGAYRPEYFDQPYPTTGYTLLS